MQNKISGNAAPLLTLKPLKRDSFCKTDIVSNTIISFKGIEKG